MRVSSTDVLCLCGEIRLTPHADIVWVTRSINCGSVLRYPERERNRVSYVARKSHFTQISVRAKIEADGNHSLSPACPSRLLPEGLLEFKSRPLLLLPPSLLCIWQTPVDIYIHNKQWIYKEKREWYRITPAVWHRRQIPHCNNHAVTGCWQILDFPRKSPPAGWMEESLHSLFNPLHYPYSSTANYKPDVAKAQGSGLSDWSRSTTHVWFWLSVWVLLSRSEARGGE